MKIIHPHPEETIARIQIQGGAEKAGLEADITPIEWKIQIKLHPDRIAGEGSAVAPELLKGWGENLPDLGTMEPDPE
jgi:hypothetical protein